MVKVIIQTKDETIVKEGDFFFGSVVSDKTEGYEVNGITAGNVNVIDIPQIVARPIVNLVKTASGPKMLDQACVLTELSNQINKEVNNELINNKEQVLSDICKAIDGLGR